MGLRQKEFGRLAGDRAVFWIRASRIARGEGSKWPVGKAKLTRLRKILPRPIVRALQPRMKRREPFFIPAGYFEAVHPLDKAHRIQLVQDFLEHRNDLRATQWFRTLARDLAQKGVARHKSIQMHSDAEIERFLNDYVGGLVDSLATKGFSDQHDGFASTVVVDAQGALCKTGSGNHRFAIARGLDLPRYPVRLVGIHEDWAEAQGLTKASVDAILAHVETLAAHAQ